MQQQQRKKGAPDEDRGEYPTLKTNNTAERREATTTGKRLHRGKLVHESENLARAKPRDLQQRIPETDKAYSNAPTAARDHTLQQRYNTIQDNVLRTWGSNRSKKSTKTSGQHGPNKTPSKTRKSTSFQPSQTNAPDSLTPHPTRLAVP